MCCSNCAVECFCLDFCHLSSYLRKTKYIKYFENMWYQAGFLISLFDCYTVIKNNRNWQTFVCLYLVISLLPYPSPCILFQGNCKTLNHLSPVRNEYVNSSVNGSMFNSDLQPCLICIHQYKLKGGFWVKRIHKSYIHRRCDVHL